MRNQHSTCSPNRSHKVFPGAKNKKLAPGYWAVPVLRGGLGRWASRRASYKYTWTRWSAHHRSTAHWAGPHESAWTRWSTHHWATAHRARPHVSAWTRWCSHHRPSAHWTAPLVIRQDSVECSLTSIRTSRGQSYIMPPNRAAILRDLKEKRAPSIHGNVKFMSSSVKSGQQIPASCCITQPGQIHHVGCKTRNIYEVLISSHLKIPLTPMPPGLSELFMAPIPKEPEPIGPRGPELL